MTQTETAMTTDNPRSTGIIYLPTASAAALFEHELVGQFSDGMWENARPYDHWKFWCNLKVMETAIAYYAMTYTMKDLRADVAHIKSAMKTVGIR